VNAPLTFGKTNAWSMGMRSRVQAAQSGHGHVTKYRLPSMPKEDAMLIQSIHYTFALEDADKAEAIFRELRDASRKEEGVITFDVARSRERPNVFALWEAYADSSALDAHKATEHFKRLALNGVRLLAQQRALETVFPI
jgi:quinol monooxygenase YgiN